MSILIVLFGQENEADGKLRLPALVRCAKAAEVYRELSPGSEVVVLPTGAFGSHFNSSEHPHFYYLRQELVRLGVPPENILPGAATSNTVQDATEAWYRFKSGGFHKLIAVTSDYHAARVALILGRLSANDDAEIEVVTADTPSEYKGKDKELEPIKVARLKREWVDVIPRSANVPPERFVKVYEDAGREHRYYDTLSWAVVAVMLIINGIAFWIVPGKDGWVLLLLLIMLAIIDLLMWLFYSRMNDAARTARRVLTRMEFEHRLPGFSSNWRPETREWFRSPPWLWSMKELVAALAALLFITLVIASFAAPSEPRREILPTRTASSNSNSTYTSPTPAGVNGNALDRWANRMLGNDNSNANRRRER